MIFNWIFKKNNNILVVFIFDKYFEKSIKGIDASWSGFYYPRYLFVKYLIHIPHKKYMHVLLVSI